MARTDPKTLELLDHAMALIHAVRHEHRDAGLLFTAWTALYLASLELGQHGENLDYIQGRAVQAAEDGLPYTPVSSHSVSAEASDVLLTREEWRARIKATLRDEPWDVPQRIRDMERPEPENQHGRMDPNDAGNSQPRFLPHPSTSRP